MNDSDRFGCALIHVLISPCCLDCFDFSSHSLCLCPSSDLPPPPPLPPALPPPPPLILPASALAWSPSVVDADAAHHALLSRRSRWSPSTHNSLTLSRALPSLSPTPQLTPCSPFPVLASREATIHPMLVIHVIAVRFSRFSGFSGFFGLRCGFHGFLGLYYMFPDYIIWVLMLHCI